jgi:Dyp-type peroxidase family
MDDPAAAERLAARIVGRWPSGAPLVLTPDQDQAALADANDFGYAAVDPYGYRCPIGAHIRRAHPRDALDPHPGSDASIALDKRHRLLRRGREYGPPLPPDETLAAPASTNDDRGLHFICVNANIARQFEFVHHTWLNNPKFAGLYDDADPLVGAHRPSGGTFTMQAPPVRTRVSGLPRFVQPRGGAYFFLPGLRALRYLARLGG